MPTPEATAYTVNGKPRLVDEPVFLPDVLAEFGIEIETARGVAVAVNDEIVRRNDWTTRQVDAGDRIEIVTARQGG